MPHADPSPVIPAEALDFLADLARNNTTTWFAEHKGEYETAVRQPLLRLAEFLAPVMAALDPQFALDPAAVVSRIRRDIRFSRDKSPFRSNQWLAFKRRSREWTGRPAFFAEFGPEMFRYGMGFYSAGAKTMAMLRELALERPEEYAAAMARAQAAGCALIGDEYKRPRQPLEQPPCVGELFRKRNVCMLRTGEPGEVVRNPALSSQLGKSFAALAPLYRFWLEAADRAADRAEEPARGVDRTASAFDAD
ncbi:MAG: hypothetical protein AUJ49_06125 [Desulfovibrionaceae bacterium CG1_02_65_16]|nr:MAG: hypothetical protein AUJ49_06125 [Desulfovibrionaceae bacterium CG1_02_65_16]